MALNTNSSSSIISLMDGLWDFSKLLKIIYYTLFLDLLLMMFCNKGIFYLSTNEKLNIKLGDVIGIIITFVFFSSFVLEIIGLFFSLFLIKIKYKLNLFNNDNHKRKYGHVYLAEIRDEAMNKQSDFLYEIYLQHEEKNRNKWKSEKRTEIISVGLFILIVLEWYFSFTDGSSQMFIDWLWNIIATYGPSTTHFSVGLFCCSLFFLYSVFTCWPRETNNTIYYLPLYLKIEEKRMKQRKEMLKFESQYNKENN
ncbi:hypothetical protein OQO17_003089 [Salmonella enterica]|nr:hypothetical protein [Salmonella enterica]